jgi:hypothetical protein
MYRGYEVSSLIDLTRQELMALFTARARRRLNRNGLQLRHRNFMQKVKLKKQQKKLQAKQEQNQTL